MNPREGTTLTPEGHDLIEDQNAIQHAKYLSHGQCVFRAGDS
jgi:hypothetical protein